MSSLNFDSSGRFSRPFFAVDGSRRPDCATTELDDAESSWQLVFPSMMTIHELVISFNVVHSSSEYYTVTFLSERGEVVYNTTSKLTNRSSLIPHTQAFVKSVEISLRNTQVPLSICEFEAYGECAPPLYGPECTEICSITCEDQVCTYDGYCNQCPKGTGGTHCFEGCLSWCGERRGLRRRQIRPCNEQQLPAVPHPDGLPGGELLVLRHDALLDGVYYMDQ
uniref:Uncharacterized protein n=1 Tax=Biomphalaria glabrata TaxID=6526 RepID=A0A2C9KW48_BIOGL